MNGSLMSERDWLADRFEAWRPHLHALAYRMLGSQRDADTRQETWLRLDRSDTSAVNDLRTWLSTVAGRVCLDMLRSRKASRVYYTGTWLPEPVVGPDQAEGPEQQAVLATGGLACWRAGSLAPAERPPVLHDSDVPRADRPGRGPHAGGYPEVAAGPGAAQQARYPTPTRASSGRWPTPLAAARYGDSTRWSRAGPTSFSGPTRVPTTAPAGARR